ncbi:hypothetical protein [Paractinoplanes atraurantiacus]|uniref:hypothetical protein n=1 Tax=Paractinoplanes atraurantiacus TaxID=1036182 RepID=UPI000BE37415|nr:hypothetical protein [Actinoplanes atraurantiacus]
MSTQDRPSLPGAWTLARDILSFAGGWLLIFLEVTRPEIRESVLVLAGSVVGVPGVALGARSVVDAVRSRAGTPGPSEPPPADPSPSSPSSSSSGA